MKDREVATKGEVAKKMIHPLLLKIMGMKTTGDIKVTGSFPKKGNYLIVANHVCIEDIPTLGQAIKKHFYLLVSDEDKGTLDGLALNLNGVEWVKRTDKEDRKRVNGHLEQILKKGRTLAMYPESTWNLSPNKFIMPMNYGCIRLALTSGVPIIPVVSIFDFRERHTVIGEKFVPTEDLEESVNKLRDIMSTMFYDEIQKIYDNAYILSPHILMKEIDGERYYYEKRSSLKDHQWDDYVDNKYEKYARARKDKRGVREFESQFIFTPKSDDYAFFQEFNSVVRTDENGVIQEVHRISSEKDGFMGDSFGEKDKDSFGFGYNEHVLKKYLKR